MQGILRSECTTEVIMAGFIWDNMPLVEKAIDAIDFSRIREGVKINKFPGFLDLNRFILTKLPSIMLNIKLFIAEKTHFG